MPFTLIAITNPDRGLRKAFLQTYPMNPKDALVVERIKKGFQLYGATLEAITPRGFNEPVGYKIKHLPTERHPQGRDGCSEVCLTLLKQIFKDVYRIGPGNWTVSESSDEPEAPYSKEQCEDIYKRNESSDRNLNSEQKAFIAYIVPIMMLKE